jgi:hypothetical protein
MKNMFDTLHRVADLDLTYLTAFKNIWLGPAGGSDSLDGTTKAQGVDTLEKAYGFLTTGKHDRILVNGDGTTAGSVRLDAAFIWAKNAGALIGLCAPTLFSQRSRLAPNTTATAFANFFTVSGHDNLFQNIQFINDFATDGDNQITVTVSGHRNVFKNCHIAGIAKGSDAGGRCLKIAGGEENLFEDCVIGLDTIDRTAANANVEFSAGAARNVFRRCIFPITTSTTTPLLIKLAAAGAIDRFNIFEDCVIWNHGAGTIAGLVTSAASPGGYIVFLRPSILGLITGFGTDATSRGAVRITGVASGSTTTGLGYAPSA